MRKSSLIFGNSLLWVINWAPTEIMAFLLLQIEWRIGLHICWGWAANGAFGVGLCLWINSRLIHFTPFTWKFTFLSNNGIFLFNVQTSKLKHNPFAKNSSEACGTESRYGGLGEGKHCYYVFQGHNRIVVKSLPSEIEYT